MNDASDAPPRPLTATQLRLYSWYFTFTLAHGYQPSYVQAASAMGWAGSGSAVCQHMANIADRGWVDLRSEGPHQGRVCRSVRFLYTPSGDRFIGFRLPGKTDAKSGVTVDPFVPVS